MKCELKQIKHDAEKEARTYNMWSYIKLGVGIIVLEPFVPYVIKYLPMMYAIIIIYFLYRLYEVRDKCNKRRK